MATIPTGPMIITRYLGPTNYRPARVVATHRRESSASQCRPWRKVLCWDHALSAEQNHQAAAESLLAAWLYETTLRISGCGYDADAYYWLATTATA